MGKVILVGAGAGDTGLLTIKGKKYIEEADCIIYDRLASPELLGMAKHGCECIYVGKENHKHIMKQDAINELLYKKSREYSLVVRLKGGDPYVFGRGGEEALYLRKRKIDIEVVPGVSSVVAALADAGIPITHRGIAKGFQVITAHSKKDEEAQIDYTLLTDESMTCVFLMGLAHVEHIAEELIRADYGKTEQSVGQTCEKKDDICGIGLGDPKEAFYVALWNEEMYGDLDIARAKVFQEFDSDKTAGESKSIKNIDEKEAEVETQFGDDEETENLEEEQPEKKDQETVEESSEKKEQETVEELPEKKEQETVEESSEKKDLKKDDRDTDLQNFRRQIMKIQRGEISILPRCEWKLANNNFLLHGYYNYRHLVLIDEGNQLKLGVPGIYHEREARAAATFGFPEFIAEADVNVTLEPQERNENQQFGYWCRQVRRPPR